MVLGRFSRHRIGVAPLGDAGALTGFGRPFGLGFDSSGRLHVTDMDLHAVFRFDTELSHFHVLEVSRKGWEGPFPVVLHEVERKAPVRPGDLNGPHAIEFSPYGRIYITTYYTPCVQVFDGAGRKLFDISDASSPHPLSGPATAFFDRDERLLVAEYKQNTVIAFDPEGVHLGNLGMSQGGAVTRFGDGEKTCLASPGPGGFDRPHMCRQAADGSLVVVDTWNHRLQRFTDQGDWLGWIGMEKGGCVTDGWCPEPAVSADGAALGAFHAPVAVDIEPHLGHMLVTDWGNDRLQILDSGGRPLAIIENLGLSRPYDARFHQGMIVVADSHHGRVLMLSERIAAVWSRQFH